MRVPRCIVLVAILPLSYLPVVAAGADPHLQLALPLPNVAPGSAEDFYLLSVAGADIEAVAAALEAAGLPVDAMFPFAGTLRVLAAREEVDALRALPFVASVDLDRAIRPTSGESNAAIGDGPAIDAAGYDGAGIAVAVVDAGVDERHPALAGRVVQYTFDPDAGVYRSVGDRTGHGTHVAGIVAGDGSGAAKGKDYSGVAPRARIVSLDLSPQFTTSNALRAFEWLHENHEDHGIRVVVNSWGRERDPVDYDPDDPIVRASNALVADGLVVVFSSGNGGPTPSRMSLEASNPHVITVGASDYGGHVEPYSSRGPVLDDGRSASWTKPDLVAPGTRIVSARADGTPGRYYTMMNGTSMAAPHVAGVAAVLLSEDPSLTPGQLQRILWETARDVGDAGPDTDTGYGVVNLHAALERLLRARGGTVARVEAHEHRGDVQGVGPPPLLPLSPAPKERTARFQFDVAEGARRLALHLNYTGHGQIVVTMESPGGGRIERRTAIGTDLVVPEPAPGRYAVTVEPSGAAKGDFDARVTVMRLEQVEPVPLPPPPPKPSGGFPAVTMTGPLSVFNVPEVIGVVVPLGLLAAGSIVLGLVMRPWRR